MTTWLKDDRGNKCSTADVLRRLTASPLDECIVWPGYLDPKGYGRVWFAGRWSLTHRASYEMNIGQIPSGLVVRHRCDNPSCVNPRHLAHGTQVQNIQDRNEKNRSAKGENHSRAKLSDADVRVIRISKESTRILGRRFGVSSSRISEIKSRKSWSHIA